MNGKTQEYFKLNGKYLKEAEGLMGDGDWVQASEKYWGAAAAIAKAVVAKRGVEINSHGELYRFVATLKQELDEPELVRLFSLAAVEGVAKTPFPYETKAFTARGV